MLTCPTPPPPAQVHVLAPYRHLSSTSAIPAPRAPADVPGVPGPAGSSTTQPASTGGGAAGDLYDISDWPYPVCPTRGHQLRRTVRGTWAPSLCGRLSCYACIVPVALDYAAAIALARPTQFARVSLVGDTWPVICRRMNRLRERLRGAGLRVRDVYHVHDNPQGTGTHAHVWMWGAGLDAWELAAAATRAGMGSDVHIQDAYLPAAPGLPRLQYGMWPVIRRPEGAAGLWPVAERYLELNGGALLHASRGFWRDGRTGESLAGVRPAVRAAKSYRRPAKPQAVAA